MNTLLRRVKRLESRMVGHTARHRRAFMCIVRQGREDEDRAQAFGALGVTIDARDFVVMHCVVSPDPNDPMDDIHPWASMCGGVENNLEISAGD